MQDLKLEKQLSANVWLARKNDGTQVVLRRLPIHNQEIMEKLQPPIPGIPRILQTEIQGQCLYVTEEYIPFPSIDKRPMYGKELLHIMNQLCSIVQSMHDRGILHRDIKPEHILTDGNQVWLVDFGAARLARPGKNRDTTLLGTAGYASPEQYGFAQTDVRSDIWSMGKVLAELDTEGTYKRITTRAMQMDPARRYASCKEFQKDLNGQLVIFPGINNPTTAGKFASLAWTVFCIVFAGFMPIGPEIQTWADELVIRLGSFYMLYSPLWALCDQQLFARLPFGRYLPVRLVYAAITCVIGFYALLILCALVVLVC